MIEFLKKVLDVLLRFLNWRRDTKRAREANAVRQAIVNHDRKKMNELLQKRRNRRD